MVDYTKHGREGKWTDLNIGSSNASVYKRTSESNITLTADAVSKKATMTLADSVSKDFDVGEYTILCSQQHLLFVNSQSKDVKGTLFFKKLSDVTSAKAKYASYNNDRIVFYEHNNTGKDFVAYVCSYLPHPVENFVDIPSAT